MPEKSPRGSNFLINIKYSVWAGTPTQDAFFCFTQETADSHWVQTLTCRFRGGPDFIIAPSALRKT